MSNAKVVLTDSGGVQEETTILGVPCITLRENTERPVTVNQGSNVLVGSGPENIMKEFNRVYRAGRGSQRSPRYWDGNAARRIVKILAKEFLPDRSIPIPAYESSAKEIAQS